jgi:hypothetical protein
MLQCGLHVYVQVKVQNKYDVFLRAFLIVGVGFLWYCWNSFLFIMVVLFAKVICLSMVMLSSSSWFRYLRLRLAVILG